MAIVAAMKTPHIMYSPYSGIPNINTTIDEAYPANAPTTTETISKKSAKTKCKIVFFIFFEIFLVNIFQLI